MALNSLISGDHNNSNRLQRNRVKIVFQAVVALLLVTVNVYTGYSQCDTSKWIGKIMAGGNATVLQTLDAQTIFNSGALTAPPSSSYPTPYYVNFDFKDTFCITNNFALELRLKNDPAAGGAISGDTWMNIVGSGINAGCLLVGVPGAQSYTAIYVGNTGANNLPQLVMNLSTWRTIRLDFIDNIIYWSYDGANFFSFPYTGSICNIEKLNVGFREAGQVDYIKLFDAANAVVYYEEFNNCNNLALAADCMPPDVIATSANASYCEGDSIQLTGSSNVTLQYTWTGPNNFSSTLQNPVIPAASLNTAGWYKLIGYVNPCTPSNKDSVYVTINPKKLTNVNPFICQGDSYIAGGVNQTVAGIYYDTLSTSLGCDSVIVTNLGILPTSATALPIAICLGDSFFVSGNYQKLAGIYYDTLQNNLGCDSVITTTLSLIYPVYHNQNLYICEGDSMFVGGAYQKLAGIFNDTTNAATGCDSIIITDLAVIAPLYTNVDVSICQGTTYFAQGAFQSLPGTYYDTLNSVLACDSIIITQLQVTPAIQSSHVISICLGDSFFVGGGYQAIAGIYIDTAQTTAGCDSISTTDLQVIIPVTGSTMVSICLGDSFFVGGSFQSLAGFYVDTIQSVAGCDSILTTELQLIPPVFTNVAVNICQGDSFLVGGSYQSQAGYYNDTLNTSFGCDSIVITNLQLTIPVLMSVTVNICTGDSFFVGGNYQSQAGIYKDTLQSSIGCDSIVTTTLQLIAPVYTDLNVSICYGDNFFAGGGFQNTAGIYNDTVVSALGCDSVLITHLQVIFPVYGNQSVSICDGQTYFAGGIAQSNSGIYYDTLTSATGCDSIRTTQLTVLPNPFVYLGADTSICEATSAILDAGNGFSSYLWNDGSSASILSANNTGSFSVTVTDQYGCMASDTLQILQLLPLPENFLPADSGVCGKFLRNIYVPGFAAYEWNSGSTDSIQTINAAGVYSLEVTDLNGCKGTDVITFESICDKALLMPNAFTPNGDGLNDVFKPVLLDDVHDFELKIFNRWGKLLFYSKDVTLGWDGREQNFLSPVEEYVWMVQYKNDAGEEQTEKGSVALIR